MSEKSEYEEMVNKIKAVQDNYYTTNKKNIIFKKSQKLDCANIVSEHIPLEHLIAKTMFNIPQSNRVYIDYTFFKLYANPDNFTEIAENIILIMQNSIDINDNVELHLNLESFTVSALERYKPVIIHFCNKCLASGTQYSEKIQKIFIYNVPKNFDSMVKIIKNFIDKRVYSKITLYDSNSSVVPILEFQNIRDNLSNI